MEEPHPPPGGPAPGSGRGTGVLVAVVAFLLLLAVAGVALVAGLRGPDGSVETRRLETPAEAASVRVDNDCGSVRVRPGTAGVVRTEARVTSRWRKPTVTSRADGDRVVVEVRCPWFGGSVALTVECPAGADVDASSAAGAVEATGLTGDLDLRSSAGSVTGRDLGSSRVSAQSSAGSVSLTWVAGADPRDVDASSSAGSVTVLLPDRTGTAYRVDADSSAGSTRVDVRTDPAAGRSVRAHSSAGSVQVGYR